MGKVAAASLASLLGIACFAGTPDTGASGKGRPLVSVEFPSITAPGSVHEAVVTVDNPGPGAVDPVVVSFSWIGGSPGEDLPLPIVDGGGVGRGQEVLSVDPEPASVSGDGVVFVFEALEAGEEMRIVFEVRVPSRAGLAANAVVVYDGRETDRAGGVRLQTRVRG